MSRIIISDTSCLIALTKIGKLDLLKELFQKVLITTSVSKEFGGTLPGWIIRANAEDLKKQEELEKRLDQGEASSIALALELEYSTLIIDEIKGRRIAEALQINIIGTVGIILLANKRGLISNPLDLILLLVNNGFRLSDKVLKMIIERFGSSQ